MLTSNLDDLFAEAEEAGAVLIARCKMLETALTRRPPPAKPHRQRKPRKPTLVSVAKQANKAALEVARYEVKPDGTVVIVTGKSETTEASNPWLDDLKVTKQ
jgi:hypothetical protein